MKSPSIFNAYFVNNKKTERFCVSFLENLNWRFDDSFAQSLDSNYSFYFDIITKLVGHPPT